MVSWLLQHIITTEQKQPQQQHGVRLQSKRVKYHVTGLPLQESLMQAVVSHTPCIIQKPFDRSPQLLPSALDPLPERRQIPCA